MDGFPPANVDAAAFLSNAASSQCGPDCPQDFYSGSIFQEETVQCEKDSSDGPETKANKCRLCDKVYARPSTLRTHMRTHSGEKPYQCHICMKSFSQDANLTAHLRIHSGEKPFKCLVCDRRYRKLGPQCKIITISGSLIHKSGRIPIYSVFYVRLLVNGRLQ